jgi:hypothetical protein
MSFPLFCWLFSYDFFRTLVHYNLCSCNLLALTSIIFLGLKLKETLCNCFEGILHSLSAVNFFFFFWWTFVTLTSPPFSYRYIFDTDEWNAVYKHKVGKNFKVKAGYDSEVRVGWASLWV